MAHHFFEHLLTSCPEYCSAYRRNPGPFLTRVVSSSIIPRLNCYASCGCHLRKTYARRRHRGQGFHPCKLWEDRTVRRTMGFALRFTPASCGKISSRDACPCFSSAPVLYSRHFLGEIMGDSNSHIPRTNFGNFGKGSFQSRFARNTIDCCQIMAFPLSLVD